MKASTTASLFHLLSLFLSGGGGGGGLFGVPQDDVGVIGVQLGYAGVGYVGDSLTVPNDVILPAIVGESRIIDGE